MTREEQEYQDWSDAGLASRSHRQRRYRWDRPGLRSSNPGLSGYDYRFHGDIYRDLYDPGYFNRIDHYGKGPKGYRRSDDLIREDVCEALYRNSEVDASEIEVTVKEGCVFLAGTVESRDAKRSAEMQIENLPGVTDVENRLKIVPAVGPTLQH